MCFSRVQVALRQYETSGVRQTTAVMVVVQIAQNRQILASLSEISYVRNTL